MPLRPLSIIKLTTIITTLIVIPPRPQPSIPFSLRPFGIDNIPGLAALKGNTSLRFIKFIELGAERIAEGAHFAARVEDGPRVDAGLAAAGFENHHEGVEAVEELVGGNGIRGAKEAEGGWW